MKFAWKYFFLGAFTGALILGGWTALWGRSEAAVLSARVESPLPVNTPEPTLTPSPTLKPTPTNIPTPTLTPTPTILPVSSEQINGFIEQYARVYSVDPNRLRHIAICESGFNPAAVNGPYAGLYQFMSKTWSSNRAFLGEDPDPGLRLKAEEAVQTAAYLLSTKGSAFWPNCQPKN